MKADDSPSAAFSPTGRMLKLIGLAWQLHVVRLPAAADAAVVKPATPMLGWSSWNRLKNDVNETVIRLMADAMVSTGLASVGFKFINVASHSLCRPPCSWATHVRVR